MADEIFIAKEATSQEIKTAVEGVQTDVSGVKTNVDGLKNTDVPNIDTLVDAVLARIGTAEDTGDTVLGRLKTLMSSGGGGGWKALFYKASHSSSTETAHYSDKSDKLRIIELSWELSGGSDDSYTIYATVGSTKNTYDGHGGDSFVKRIAVPANSDFKVSGRYINSKYAATLQNLTGICVSE